MKIKSAKDLCWLLSLYRMQLENQGQGKKFTVKVHLTKETIEKFFGEMIVKNEISDIKTINGYEVIEDNRNFIEISHRKYF